MFADGTPGDGSRTLYTDMMRMTWHVTEESKFDAFALYNSDRNKLRWGYRWIPQHRTADTAHGIRFGRVESGVPRCSFTERWISQTRYDFPLLLAPENASGIRRFEIFGHLLAEFFNPGDYYDTQRPAWFVRWQIDVKF